MVNSSFHGCSLVESGERRARGATPKVKMKSGHTHTSNLQSLRSMWQIHCKLFICFIGMITQSRIYTSFFIFSPGQLSTDNTHKEEVVDATFRLSLLIRFCLYISKFWEMSVYSVSTTKMSWTVANQEEIFHFSQKFSMFVLPQKWKTSSSVSCGFMHVTIM